MRVLITRPLEDARETAEALKALGHQPIVEPLLDITFEEGPPVDTKPYRLLLVTSMNGARAAAKRIPDRHVPLLAVGRATASEARRNGFTDVSTADGEGTKGILSALARLDRTDGRPLLHLSGADTAGDLLAAASDLGFAIRRIQLYSAQAALGLSRAAHAALAARAVDAAMFFSPRTAAVFCQLASAAGLSAHVDHVWACAISSNAAAALSSITFRKVLVAEQATAQAMLDLLGHLAPAGPPLDGSQDSDAPLQASQDPGSRHP